MFGKPLFARAAVASSPAPQFQLGPHTQSASKKPSSVFKKLFHVKNVFPRFSSAKKDAISQGTSRRRQRVLTPQPSHEGLAALAEDGVGFERPYQAHLRSLGEPTRSPASLNLSPRFQTGLQSSTPSTVRRSNFSANGSPLPAPPQSVATAPATTFARPRSSSHSSPHSAVSRSSTSPNPSLLAPPQFVATTPATSFAPARPSSQRSTQSTTPRLTFSAKISSPLATPQSVAPARSASRPSAPPSTPRSTGSPNASSLLAPPPFVAATPATQPSHTLSALQCSKPSRKVSPANQLIAELQGTIAFLDRQHNDCVRSVQSMIQDYIFPHTTSIVDETASAKKELEEVNKKIADVDKECSKLEGLWHEECENLVEAEEALKKAKWHLEGVDEEQATLQAQVHRLQAGQPVNGVWVERVDEASQRDSTSSQPAAENAEEEGGASFTAPESSQLERKAVKSWDSQCESQIALGRYSVPRSIQPVQAATNPEQEDTRSESDGGKAQAANLAALNPALWMNQARGGGPRPKTPRAGTVQQLVTASNESGGQTADDRLRAAIQAYRNGTPLPLEITITTKFTRGQAVPRGKISLPKDARAKAETVLVFASGKSLAAAKDAGAHYVGGEELIPEILESKIQPTKVIYTPTLLPIVQQKLGRFLGPKGLMPAEKRGTVTMTVGPAVQQVQGTMNWKSGRYGVVRARVARINWTADDVVTNVKAFVSAVKQGTSSDGADAAIGKKKPSSILHVFLSSIGQGPGIRLLDAM